MEFGVCSFLDVASVTRLLQTCRRIASVPVPYRHLVPGWCSNECAKTVAMLHGGYASELITVKDMCYNKCCSLPAGAIFAGTYNTQMPLRVDSDFRQSYCYLGLRDVLDVCALSDGTVVVATAHAARRYTLLMDAESVRFTSFVFSNLFSVPTRRLVYGVALGVSTADYRRVVRVSEAHQCSTLSSMRNPIIAVNDNYLYVACCLNPSRAVFCVAHSENILEPLAILPDLVMQIIGLPNGSLAVRCTDSNVYLFAQSKTPSVFSMGAGHMVAVGEVIYCREMCLCTTTQRMYKHKSGNSFVGVCNNTCFALAPCLSYGG